MFGPDWMESLSKVYWWVPPAVYLPVLALLLSRLIPEIGALRTAAWWMVGAAIWTPTEYLMHRFVFHYHPRSGWGKRLHFILHGVHHDYPSDAHRLVMPPSASLPIAAAFFALFVAIFGLVPAQGVMAGFLCGYLVYDLLHYAMHHAQFRSGSWLYRLKRHHMQHHFSNPSRGFGVSSPLWDKVFRT